MLIRAMTATGVAYDPEAVVVGGDLLPSGGVVILTGHFLTNGVLGRMIFDQGELWCVIAAEIEDRYYPGLRVQYETIFAGPAALVRARARLRQGIKVLGLVDSSAAGDRRLPVATAIGQRYISPALAALAVNLGVPILFAASAFDDRNRFVVTIERPKSSDAARIAEEFCEFYTERAAAIRR